MANGSGHSGSTTHASNPVHRCARGAVRTGVVHEATTFGANRATASHAETPLPVALSITSELERLDVIDQQRPTVKPAAGRKLHQRRKSDSAGKNPKTLPFLKY